MARPAHAGPSLDLVLSRLQRVHRQNRGWAARCPAHDDRNASLSIGLSEQGRVLLFCHAGCPAETVLARVGLTFRELNEADGQPGRTGTPARRVPPHELASDGQECPSYSHFSHSNSATYDYRDAHGQLLYQVVRLVPKGFRQRQPDGRGGWRWSLEGVSRVLYRLPELRAAAPEETVFVVEGEKDVEALRSLGLVATTNAGGARKWLPEFAQELAGRNVVILPDNDEPGRKHAALVARSIAAINPNIEIRNSKQIPSTKSEIKIVHLPNLPPKGDVSDYLSAGGTRESLEALIEAAPAWKDNSVGRALLPVKGAIDGQECPSYGAAFEELPELPTAGWQPFPVEVLPEPMRSFVSTASTAVGCEPSFVALPLLASLAASIGNTRRIRLKSDWAEPAIVWAAIVGDSGTLKSPAWRLATAFLKEKQQRALETHQHDEAAWRNAVLAYEAALKAWQRRQTESPRKTHKAQQPDACEALLAEFDRDLFAEIERMQKPDAGGQSGERSDSPRQHSNSLSTPNSQQDDPPPQRPPEVVPARYLVSDTTIEALADRLQHAPRGLLLAADELACWLSGIAQYKGGRGSDIAHWLSMFHADLLLVDRKSGQPKTICVERASVSITGGIQPQTLARALGKEHFENGLAARLLLAYPPKMQRRWNETTLDAALVAQMSQVFDVLLSLPFGLDEAYRPAPLDLPLTPEAKQAFVEFYNRHGEEEAGFTSELAAAWSKLEAYAPRLALVLHCVRVAARDETLDTPDAVDRKSIEAGIALARWFGQEAERVYAVLRETEEERHLRELVELVRRKGGSITARELTRSSRRYRNRVDLAQEALRQLLAQAGWGSVETREQNSLVFRLSNCTE